MNASSSPDNTVLACVFGVYVVVLTAVLLVRSLHVLHPAFGAVVATCVVAAIACARLFADLTLHSRLLESCLRIHRGHAMKLLVAGTVLFPLYPVLVLPLLVTASVLLALGKCSI